MVKIKLLFQNWTFPKYSFWKIWHPSARLQTNDFLIINFFMENPKNFNDVKPYHKLHTSLESSPRAERCQIFQKLYFGNVQFRKSNFIFTIICSVATIWCRSQGPTISEKIENIPILSGFVFLFYRIRLFWPIFPAQSFEMGEISESFKNYAYSDYLTLIKIKSRNPPNIQ